MGTRHLVMVVKDGDFKVAQYGQGDGYPSGQGITVLNFLRKKMRRPSFDESVKALRPISEQELEALWIECGATKGSNLVGMDVAAKFNKRWPWLDRDHGAEILSTVQDSMGDIQVRLSTGFAADSLFCEWAYVIDLDKNALEVYRGFNQEPVPSGERFANLTPPERDEKYYPVKLVRKYNFDALPTKRNFLKDLEPKDEE